MATTFTGIVTKVELRIFDSLEPNYYLPYTVCKDAKLLVAMDTDEGPVWFYTPKTDRWISSPPGAGCAVLCLIESDWIGSEPAQGNKVTGKNPVPKIEMGQRLSVRARVKRDTQYGKQLYYVKMLK